MLVSLCTMLVSADHGHVALQLHLLATLPCFFRSRYVRAATCCRFHRQKKWFPSLQSLNVEVARDFYVAKHRIRTSWGVCRLLGCSRPPSAALQLPTAAVVVCIAARNQTFHSYLSLKLRVLPLHAEFPSGLVVSNHATLKLELCSTLRRKKQGLPETRLHVHEVRLTSVSFVRVGNESRFSFLFSDSREECSSGRNDAHGLRVLGAKLRCTKFSGRKTSRSTASRKMRLCARVFRALESVHSTN